MNRNTLPSIFSLLSILFLLGCGQSKKTDEFSKPEINELPYLSYQTLRGDSLSTRTLPGNTILILFNTSCDHCQRKAKEISEKREAFREYELLFIAADSLHRIEDFSKMYNLSDLPNVSFGHAEYRDVFMNFGSIPTPAIYIYSRERKFVKSFLGESTIEELINYL